MGSSNTSTTNPMNLSGISFKKSSINFNPISSQQTGNGASSILDNLKNVIPKKGPIKLK